MPFTFSHPAIVLPFYKLVRRWVSLTGLVIGCIVPDFEYFIRMRTPSLYSHTLWGLLWFDLPLGLILCFLFHNLVRNSFFSNLPYFLHCRLSPYKRFKWNKYFLKYWYLVIPCIVFGAFTHLVWDKFVHENGYIPTLFNFFNKGATLGDIDIPEYKTLHFINSLVGGIIVIYAIMQLPVVDKIRRPFFYSYWICIAVIMLIVLAIRYYTGLDMSDDREVVINLISGCLMGIIFMSIFNRRSYYR